MLNTQYLRLLLFHFLSALVEIGVDLTSHDPFQAHRNLSNASVQARPTDVSGS